MKNISLLPVVMLILLSSSAFADGDERCQGVSQNGEKIILVGNYLDDDMPCQVDITTQGKTLSYGCQGVDAGTTAEGYESSDYGGLKVTFYDQNLTVTGWSAKLGDFKLQCTQE
jgi:hypothetical protein